MKKMAPFTGAIRSNGEGHGSPSWGTYILAAQHDNVATHSPLSVSIGMTFFDKGVISAYCFCNYGKTTRLTLECLHLR